MSTTTSKCGPVCRGIGWWLCFTASIGCGWRWKMAIRPRIKWNYRAMPHLRSEAVSGPMLRRYASRLAESCNGELKDTNEDYPGFAFDVKQGRRVKQGRARATVWTRSRYAKRHNARHNTLVKKLGAL